jgi:hypothetical protein
MSLFDPFSAREGTPAPSARPRSQDGAITELQGELERLLLITEALWRILKEQHGLDEKELVRQITMIDLEDGRLDGRKPAKPPQPCPKCQRPLGKHRARCLFCGEPIAADPFQR